MSLSPSACWDMLQPPEHDDLLMTTVEGGCVGLHHAAARYRVELKDCFNAE